MGNYVLKNNHVHIKVSSLITFEIPESNVPITLSAFPRRIAMNFLNPDIFWRRNPKNIIIHQQYSQLKARKNQNKYDLRRAGAPEQTASNLGGKRERERTKKFLK